MSGRWKVSRAICCTPREITIPGLPSYLDLADRIWPVLNRVMHGHVAVYRATGGRIGRKGPGPPPMRLLEPVGARTGKKRTTPLVYMPDGDDYVVVASKGGFPKHPGWLHNLRAAPAVEVQVGAARIPVCARAAGGGAPGAAPHPGRRRRAGGEERSRLWRRAVEYNSVWGDYQKRTEREIPLV